MRLQMNVNVSSWCKIMHMNFRGFYLFVSAAPKWHKNQLKWLDYRLLTEDFSVLFILSYTAAFSTADDEILIHYLVDFWA